MIMMAMMWSMAKSVRHDVGGDDHGWNTNINMTKWSSDKQFHLNEWLCKFFFSFFLLFHFFHLFFLLRRFSSYSVVHAHHEANRVAYNLPEFN